MLGTIIGILLVLWLLGFFALHAGGIIQALLVIALVIVMNLVSGRRAV